jgi:pyridinium-3,5-bisthiocarboxylic acid mononucleotide nickel chelatase
MRIAYLDCFSGISGDMFLGALVDAGVSADVLKETVRRLNLGAELQLSRVDRCGISATKVDVVVNGVRDAPRDVEFAHAHTHTDVTTHSHEHSHSHPHSESHSHSHVESQKHSHRHELHERVAVAHSHEHRGLREIRAIIEGAEISSTAKQTALAIFQALGEAEAKIHNKDIESIHFHEVGAVDAIVDIVCAGVAAEELKVDEWRCSALNVGGGTVECAHGTLPVPAPATLELLKGAKTYSGAVQKELVTPTGAAIVRVLVKEFSTMPAMSVEKSGYGAGARDFASMANVVRIVVGEAAERGPSGTEAAYEATASSAAEVVVLEANVDDMTPQVFGYVIERLLEAGALDAFGTQAHMKKNRPGMLLTVLARPEDEARISEIIFSETTTIGLRKRRESRTVLERRFVSVKTEWGEVRIKLAERDGKLMNAAPEFDDCRRLAVEHKVPLKMVMAEAMRLFGERSPQ